MTDSSLNNPAKLIELRMSIKAKYPKEYGRTGPPPGTRIGPFNMDEFHEEPNKD